MTTPLFDVHAHFLTEEYITAAKAAGHEFPDGMPGWPTWTAENSLALMDECGISRAVLSISSPGVHFGDDAAARTLARQVNEAGAQLRKDHPDRFGHFASLPLPDVVGAIEEARYALDVLGSDGVILESNSQGQYLGNPDFAPLWKELSERRAIVFVHPTSPHCGKELFLGRPRPMFEFLVDTARSVSDLIFSDTLQKFPGIRWIFTHGGGVLPLLADRFELFRQGFPGVQGLDTTTPIPQQLSSLWFDMAGTPFPHQIPALIDVVGSEQLLYGSDSCWTPDAAVRAQVASIDDTAQPKGTTWRALTSKNAKKLFG
ncbi:MAG: amidohydrolase family protein [Rothia sp. (in: high G+C Gram-positive bacteria)]|nr:amidohydrolase family protein [Rothia sp. (in: high G+C Gram-positive bacteria)]